MELTRIDFAKVKLGSERGDSAVNTAAHWGNGYSVRLIAQLSGKMDSGACKLMCAIRAGQVGGSKLKWTVLAVHRLRFYCLHSAPQHDLLDTGYQRPCILMRPRQAVRSFFIWLHKVGKCTQCQGWALVAWVRVAVNCACTCM